MADGTFWTTVYTVQRRGFVSDLLHASYEKHTEQLVITQEINQHTTVCTRENIIIMLGLALILFLCCLLFLCVCSLALDHAVRLHRVK